MLKKSILIFLSLLLLFTSSLSIVVSAEGLIINKGIITIDNVDAVCGDTVIVAINIDENPGFSALSVSVNYDSSVLKYNRHISGSVIDCDSKAHPDRNIIRLVGGLKGSGDRKGNGTIINLEFSVLETEESHFSKIDITYNEGDFSNWDLDKVMPQIVSGGVNVNVPEKVCKHNSYTEWVEIVSPTCNDVGIEQRKCKNCDHSEIRDINAAGHYFNDFFTVDIVATDTEKGKLSLHCKNCSVVNYELSFTVKDAEKVGFKNELGAVVKNNERLKEMLTDAYPDYEENENPSSKPQPPTNSNSHSTQSDIEKPQNETDSNSISQPTNDKEKDDSVKIYDKIKEAFPNADLYLKVFVIVLAVILIISII